MNKGERLSAGNIDIYEKHVQSLLSYFETWKIAQMRRKRRGDRDWNPSFFAHQTYRNIRMSMCQFIHFSRYMVEIVFADDDELSYIPMLASNQSSLEGRFSSHRRRKLDSGSTYSKGVSTTLHKQVQSAQSASSASYDVGHLNHTMLLTVHMKIPARNQ